MPDTAQQLEGGAYEVIRARLDQQAAILRERIEALNAARHEVFGAIPTELLATGHVGTAHNCVPRDLVSLGKGLYLFGYNIQFGLKQTTELADVFAVCRLDEQRVSIRFRSTTCSETGPSTRISSLCSAITGIRFS
jgi:hypothetical protein